MNVFSGCCGDGAKPGTATGRNQVHIPQRVNCDCRLVDATIGNPTRDIQHDFPISLLLSEIMMVTRHISLAFREERNSARKFRSITILDELRSQLRINADFM
ncbi:protein of unknown function [Hyphomicrobium sp. MC1]|nr:protein of unknown function [Hyphomicrobium sp. MC1]